MACPNRTCLAQARDHICGTHGMENMDSLRIPLSSGSCFTQDCVSSRVKLPQGQIRRPAGSISQKRMARRRLVCGVCDGIHKLLEISSVCGQVVCLRVEEDKFHFAAEVKKRLHLRANGQFRAAGIWSGTEPVRVDVNAWRVFEPRCIWGHDSRLHSDPGLPKRWMRGNGQGLSSAARAKPGARW